MRPGVARFFAILMGFVILLSLGAGSIAHAAEPIICAADTVLEDHNDVTPDLPDNQGPDKAAHHAHGSCHGHHVATADSETSVAASRPPSSLHVLRDQGLAPEDIAARTLRPPIA
jgi:hypothetical protein